VPAFERAEHERRLSALAERQAKLDLPLAVIAEHRDGFRRQCDFAAASFLLW